MDKGHEVVPVEFDRFAEPAQTYVRLSEEERADAVSVSENASSGIIISAGKFKIDIDMNTSLEGME